jgi:hypothetical protein
MGHLGGVSAWCGRGQGRHGGNARTHTAAEAVLIERNGILQRALAGQRFLSLCGCPSEELAHMWCSGGHVAKDVRQMAAMQAAYARMSGWFGTWVVHVAVDDTLRKACQRAACSGHYGS